MADKFSLKAIISAVDKLSPTLKGIRLNAKITQKSLLDIKGAAGSLLTSAGITGAAVAGGIFGAVKKVVDVSSQFEKFQTILETLEGTSEKARISMDWVQNFAIKTPYELQEVTDSFVRLRSYGLDPMKGSLLASGNAAAAMGKPLEQAVEALADAMTGENERLKEFGIKASKAGNQIRYTWTESGKSMVAIAKANSRDQIEAVITGIWNRRYGGAMDKLSTTWGGLWSNMSDMVTKFIKKIGGAGFFDSIKGQLQSLLARFDQWEKDGTLDRIAKSISDNLIVMLKDMASWVESVDWEKFFQGVRETVRDVSNLVQAMGGLKTVAIVLAALLLAGPVSSLIQIGVAVARLIPVLFTLGKAFMLMVVANPVMLAIVAAIAAIGGAVYLIYRQWDPAKGWFENLWNGIKDVFAAALQILIKVMSWSPFGMIVQAWMPLTEFFSGLWDGIKSAFSTAWDNLKTLLSWSPLGLIMRNWGPIADFFGGLWNTVKGVADATPVQTSAQSAPAGEGRGNFAGLNNRTQLNGEISVQFKNAPAGMRVSQGKTNQSGVSMNPDVGYRPFSFGL